MRKEFAKGKYLSEQGMYFLEALLQVDSVQFSVRLGVDTGFNGGIFLPDDFSKKFESLGVAAYSAPLILADGNRIEAKTYSGAIKQISEYQFNPSISVPIFCYGKGSSLIGLEAINRWISEFHGPKHDLTLFCCQG